MNPTSSRNFQLPSASKVHFVGVAGAGMSAVAKMLQDLGWIVSGSDEAIYPPISDTLSAYGIACGTPYAAENIPKDATLIVIGKNAKLTPDSNPEVAAALTHPAHVVSFPQIIGALTRGKDSIVIAGSYGKSTTTSLVAWILESACKNPSYFIGAAAKNFTDYGQTNSDSTLFVLEGDEYPAANWDDQSKFLFYNARSILLTSAEHDHVNVFPTHEAYLQPFFELITQLNQDDLLVACSEGQATDMVAAKSAAPVVWYGISHSHHTNYWAENIRSEKGITSFTLIHNQIPVATITTPLLGRAFIQNSVGAAALLLERELVTAEELVTGIASFQGVKRRLEWRGTSNFPVYEDFGSSYPKCRAGIDTLLEAFPTQPLVVVFDPHTFSFRSREALHWYDTLFLGCDTVLVLPPPNAGATNPEQVSQQEIVDRIQASGISTVVIPNKESVFKYVHQKTTGRDAVVLVTSSGAIESVVTALL